MKNPAIRLFAFVKTRYAASESTCNTISLTWNRSFPLEYVATNIRRLSTLLTVFIVGLACSAAISLSAGRRVCSIALA